MGRRATAVWLTAGLMIGALALLVVVGADQDGGAPTLAESTALVDPTAYASEIRSLCTDGVAAAETTGYEESSGAGAEALDELAVRLAAVPPPEGLEPMAQALVDGVADYADLFRGADDNAEAFSQAQNELTVVIEVRAAGLGADCGEGDVVLFAPEPADPDDVTAAGDSVLSDLAGACFAGELAACDDLTGSGSALVYYGVTCGGRLLHEEADEHYSCVESFADDRPTGDQP